MARYIDADWLKTRYEIMQKDACESCTDTDCSECYEDLLYHAPTADVAPVVHGRWIWTETGDADYEQYWACSNCGDKTYFETNYCQNCGARMDLEPPEEG